MLSSDIRNIQNDPKIKSSFEENEKLIQKEIEIQKNYNQDLGRKDIIWWETESRKLWQKQKYSKQLESNMYQRVLNYLSLICNMQSTTYLNKNNLNGAAYFLDLYKMVDPDNKDVYYLTALYLAKLGQKENALQYLKKSIELGFDDFTRMKNQTAFKAYQEDEVFKSLLPAKIK